MGISDSALLRQLDRLRMRVRTARGLRPGETPIPRTSQAWGIEFESYKEYTPGDDFRYLDWHALGRLDQLVVKTFTAEREIPYHLFLDTSASMRVPAIDQKFAFATTIIEALSYIVLANNDTLRIIALTAPEKGRLPFFATPALRHHARFFRIPPFLAALVPAGKTHLQDSIRAYLNQTKEPGVAVVVSDFLVEPSQYEEPLLLLRARGYEVKALHVLGAAELSPTRLFRRGKLHDVEEHSERWITLTQAHLQQYQAALHDHLAALQQFCHRHHILYARVSTEQPPIQVITEVLTRAGFLAFR